MCQIAEHKLHFHVWRAQVNGIASRQAGGTPFRKSGNPWADTQLRQQGAQQLAASTLPDSRYCHR
jgi:hypothetical protein